MPNHVLKLIEPSQTVVSPGDEVGNNQCNIKELLALDPHNNQVDMLNMYGAFF